MIRPNCARNCLWSDFSDQIDLWSDHLQTMVQTVVRSNFRPDPVISVWEHSSVRSTGSDHKPIWVWTSTWVLMPSSAWRLGLRAHFLRYQNQVFLGKMFFLHNCISVYFSFQPNFLISSSLSLLSQFVCYQYHCYTCQRFLSNPSSYYKLLRINYCERISKIPIFASSGT